MVELLLEIFEKGALQRVDYFNLIIDGKCFHIPKKATEKVCGR